jgi:hypothetical protein
MRDKGYSNEKTTYTSSDHRGKSFHSYTVHIEMQPPMSRLPSCIRRTFRTWKRVRIQLYVQIRCSDGVNTNGLCAGNIRLQIIAYRLIDNNGTRFDLDIKTKAIILHKLLKLISKIVNFKFSRILAATYKLPGRGRVYNEE